MLRPRKKQTNFFQKIFSSQIFWLFVGIICLVFIAVPLYSNWQQRKDIDKEISELKEKIANFESSNKELDEMIEYFNSEESLELKARNNLGLKKPGETVVVIRTEEAPSGPKILQENNINEEVSNPKRWFRYFVK